MNDPVFAVADLPARMQSKVTLEGECWTWTGAKNPKGYGSMSAGMKNKSVLAHRMSYTLAKGEIPSGLQIDHLCENTSCINPAHLEAVTAEEHRRRIGHRDLEAVYAPEHGPYRQSPEVLSAFGEFFDRIAASRRRYEGMSPQEKAQDDARRHRLHLSTGTRCSCVLEDVFAG